MPIQQCTGYTKFGNEAKDIARAVVDFKDFAGT